MPRYPSRRYKARPVRRRKLMKRSRRYRTRKTPKHGGTFIVRKVQELISSVPTNIAGGYSFSVSNNSITLGTPVATPAIGLNTYDVPFTIKFRLDELTQSGELTGLFDRYKINSAMIKCSFNNYPGDVRIPLPYIDYLQDYDDAILPTVSGMREKMGVKSKYFSATRNTVTMGVRPRVATEVYGNGINTYYAVPRGSTWINSQYPGVEHYGIKGVIRNIYLPPTQSSSPMTWDISYGVALKDAQ